MEDSKVIIFAFAIAFMVAGLVMVSLHEKHYQSRRLRILEAKYKAIEEIITEERQD